MRGRCGGSWGQEGVAAAIGWRGLLFGGVLDAG